MPWPIFLLSLVVVAASSEEEEVVRVLLLGKTGAGKSSVGNAMLGRRAFESSASPRSVTSSCQEAGTVAPSGLRVRVVDTPGLCDTEMPEERVKVELERCVRLSLPGPHVLLLVVSLKGRQTREETDAVDWIARNYGPDASLYTTVVFTHLDALAAENRTAHDHLRESLHLRRLTDRCGGRWLAVGGDPGGDGRRLLERVEELARANRGQHYSNDMYRRAQLEQEAVRLAQEALSRESAQESTGLRCRLAGGASFLGVVAGTLLSSTPLSMLGGAAGMAHYLLCE